ncbi:MAG: metallophosphoesterase [Gammaproteobacteria bacterium]|nr:metallophosphoesterase [Gammaproteobacteria bacterium]
MRKSALVRLLFHFGFAVLGLHCLSVYGDDSPVTVIAAGDIGECRLPGASLTANLIEKMEGDILAVGDLVYPEGAPKDYIKCYEPTWGRFKARTLPTPGNHDYGTRDAAGYFGYFGTQAGEIGKGYYSVDRPGWHIVALNSNIDARADSEQVAWLQHDLATTQASCILAFWHHPRYSSGPHGNNNHMAAIWEILAQHHASIVISGHDHDYERLAPMDGAGQIDVPHGIRSFVVGTGGARLYNFSMRSSISEAWNGNTWGALKLTLFPGRYRWEFVPIEGGNYQDSGEGRCATE